MGEVVLLVFYATWFVATAIAGVRFGDLRDSRHRLIHHLIPRWNFFAPLPGTVDFLVLIRYGPDEDRLGPWKLVPELRPRREAWDFLWNPGKRQRKVLHDLCASLVSLAGDDKPSPEMITISLSYLTLLCYLIEQNVTVGLPEDVIQFAIHETQPAHGKDGVVFVSAVHSP